MIDYNKYTPLSSDRVSSTLTITKARTVHKKKTKLSKQNIEFLKLIGLKK